MPSEITISKNGITVTVYSVEVSNALDNKLFPITPPQTSNNQSSGPKDVRIIDLLRITEQINITRGYIAQASYSGSTAKDAKDALKDIFNGANANGGVCSLVYDGDTYTGYIEKLTFTEVSSDEPDSPPDDFAKYSVQLNFIVGTAI